MRPVVKEKLNELHVPMLSCAFDGTVEIVDACPRIDVGTRAQQDAGDVEAVVSSCHMQRSPIVEEAGIRVGPPAQEE